MNINTLFSTQTAALQTWGDLAGKKIGFTKGFFFGDFIRTSYPEIKIVTFDSTLASFIGVKNGLVDAAIDVPVVGQRLLSKAELENTIKQGGAVTDPRFITTFYIATRKSTSCTGINTGCEQLPGFGRLMPKLKQLIQS